ncbi:hypothetical protein [Schlesneria sp. T3-172]|uniref:hypothetical protein n=1 Tax=Schlesneria sphaerica TaxID=3373610 RepID=UPI0037C9CE05
MQAVRGNDTFAEVAMVTNFTESGWTYLRNVANLTGKPDFVYLPIKPAVFSDDNCW